MKKIRLCGLIVTIRLPKAEKLNALKLVIFFKKMLAKLAYVHFLL